MWRLFCFILLSECGSKGEAFQTIVRQDKRQAHTTEQSPPELGPPAFALMQRREAVPIPEHAPFKPPLDRFLGGLARWTACPTGKKKGRARKIPAYRAQPLCPTGEEEEGGSD